MNGAYSSLLVFLKLCSQQLSLLDARIITVLRKLLKRHKLIKLIEFIDAQYPDLDTQLLTENRVIDDDLAVSNSIIPPPYK